MSEEEVEMEAVAEDEVAELSAEELLEQHKAEIEARFEEKGFFRRMGDMFSGLSKPKSSREYKLAKTELQRLVAPLVALLLPVMGVIILIVITAVQGQTEREIKVDLARPPEDVEELQEEEEIEEVEPQEMPEEMPDIQVDTPVAGPVSEMVSASVTPTTEPLSVKPATQDSVAIIKSPITMKSMTASRNPGSIGKMTKGGASYGDKNTEEAVMKALRWLKKTQQSNGSWAGGFPAANAGIAILTFLAHGETPGSREFGETVEKAIQFLINSQYERPDGKVSFKGVDGNEYAVLIATYALCEAYGMTKNPNVKIAAMKSLKRIVENQGPNGGWDYGIKKESTRDDMSFEGWALQAIKAGKMAGLHPDGLESCIKKAMKCLKTRNFNKIGFNYTGGGGATGLTATGCLCMQLLGYGDQPEVRTSLETMGAWLPTFDGTGKLAAGDPVPGKAAAQYYCYYAAQCKYQAGMKEGANPADTKNWQEWNVAMKQLYPTVMKDAGTILDPDGKEQPCAYWPQGYSGAGQPCLSTCLVALQLMVYYRYLPTTQTKAGKVSHDDEEDDRKSKKADKDDDIAVEVDI